MFKNQKNNNFCKYRRFLNRKYGGNSFIVNEFVKHKSVLTTIDKYKNILVVDNKFCVFIDSKNPLLFGKWDFYRLFSNRFSIKQYLSSEDNFETKIKLLRAYTNLKIKIKESTYKQHREFKRHIKKKVVCSVCEKNDAYCYHHIQLVKNGGSNEDYNLIPICKECHQKIHSWIKT